MISDEMEDDMECLPQEIEFTDEKTEMLHKYARLHHRYSCELEEAEKQMARIIRNIKGRQKALEARYGPTVRAILTAKLLGRKTKSVRTPWGLLGMRSYGPKIDIKDEKALMEFLSNNNHSEAVRYETTAVILKSEVNKIFEATGDVPPGCEYVSGGERLYVS